MCMHVYVCVRADTPHLRSPSDPALHKERAGGKQNAWGKPGRRARMRAGNNPGSGEDSSPRRDCCSPPGRCCTCWRRGSSGAGRGPAAASRGPPYRPWHTRCILPSPALARPHAAPAHRPLPPSIPHTAPASRSGCTAPAQHRSSAGGKDKSLLSPLRRPGARGCPPVAGQVQAGGGTA